jgi:hypothetical protein
VQIQVRHGISLRDFANTVAAGAGPVQAHKEIGASENLYLFDHLGCADAEGFHLLAVRTGKPNSHKFATRLLNAPPWKAALPIFGDAPALRESVPLFATGIGCPKGGMGFAIPPFKNYFTRISTFAFDLSCSTY